MGELDAEQVFYMMTRGLTRSEAVRILVEGYFEEVVQRLNDEGLQALVRRRIAEKLQAAEEQVAQFIEERIGEDQPDATRRGGGLMAPVAATKLDVRADFPLLRPRPGLPRLGGHLAEARDR